MLPKATEYISQQPEVASRLRGAFPASLSTEVDSILTLVPVSRLPPTQDDIGPVTIKGEELHIPGRIYFPEAKTTNNGDLDDIQKIILACLYTRHHNGHIRQKYLESLCHSRQEWVPPFLLKLLAEYVIEIGSQIETNLASLDREVYSGFALENPQFIYLCQHEIVSYWNWLYRDIPFEEYPSYKIFQSLALWKGGDARRLLRRSGKLP
jgi:hypothetical protein